jgi:hypothetical protein
MAPPLRDPQLVGVHAGGSAVWVWGLHVDPGGTYPPQVARRWDGSAWAARDPLRAFLTEQTLVSGYSGAAEDAWVSGSHFGFSTVAEWISGAWVTQLSTGRQYLTGLSATDLYAIVGATSTPTNTLQYYHHTGGGWGTRQSVTPGGITYSASNPIIIGDGIPTNSSLDPAGIRAVTCPDGAVIVTGGGSETGTLARYAFVWMLQSGAVSEVRLISQESDGARVRFDGLFAADNSHVYLVETSDPFGTPVRTLYRWDRVPGDPWVSQTVPSWGCGSALHGVGPSDWWMLDDGLSTLRVSHWNGSAFTDYSLPDPLAPDSGWTLLQGIWAVASNDVWIVGRSYNSTRGQYVAPVWHWAGSAWVVQTVFTS